MSEDIRMDADAPNGAPNAKLTHWLNSVWADKQIRTIERLDTNDYADDPAWKATIKD